MSKRSVFTTVTPLPSGITRQIVLDFLHNHEEMIDLNPLVKERHPIPTPPHAAADEQDCQWYSLTDKISYLPGGLVTGDVTYTCAFHDLPTGLQTHCYAPAGLTIRDKWTVGGSLPNEPPQPTELGLRAPPTGLYLREDVDMRCNVIMASFVKKTLKKSHAALVERLTIKAEIASSSSSRGNGSSSKLVPLSTIRSSSSRPSSVIDHDHYLPASAPSSHASSAASSPSCYSVQSSALWSPSATTSLGTSPALSSKSPPTTSNGFQRQYQPVMAPSASPGKPFFAQPTTDVNESTEEPDTPFFRQHQPDWPMKTSAGPHERPPSHIQPYYPPNYDFTEQGYPTSRGAPSRVYDRGGLENDALWKALGGGRFSVYDRDKQSGNGNGNANATATASTRNPSNNRNRSESHPDYPQLNPYDDENNTRFAPRLAGGMERAMMPLPLRIHGAPRAELGSRLNAPFIAEME